MFESSLIDLEEKKQPRRRRWMSLPIAVALHLVGFTALAFASYWTVAAVQEPSISDPFIWVHSPPTPRAKLGDGAPKRPTPASRQERTVQPDLKRIPDNPSAPAASTPVNPEPADIGPNVSNTDGTGDPNGDRDGVLHGNPDGVLLDKDTVTVGTETVDSGEPIHLTAAMTRPELIHQVQIRYRHQTAIQGTVVVEAVIDEQGRVTNVRVLRGLPMGLDRAVVEAIQQWRFRPATLAGKPVKVYYTLTVNFTIQR